ncbi:MAG: hypothetical protein QOH51_1781 [Acidobacteriota bacterium]|jgi:hypothetical protein|nr:hypothetical protein [Acidobacteriota bacterium]
MDEVGSLINQFREEGTQALANPDSSVKDKIIRRLESSDDPRVLPFMLEALSDACEYDLARIEILKVLELRRRGDSSEDELIGQSIRRILADDPDDDVRTYAAMAASNYMDVEGVLDEVERTLFNEGEETNIRWNAFTAVKEMGPNSRSIEIMSKAAQVDEFKNSALRILKEWKASV